MPPTESHVAALVRESHGEPLTAEEKAAVEAATLDGYREAIARQNAVGSRLCRRP